MSVHAASTPELEQCRALSAIPKEVHNCMDNFLDAMDVDMASYESLVADKLGGLTTESGVAFSAAQESFRAYRRDNCLWYQAFSLPSLEAGQIAKSCLVEISRARLEELAKLLEDDVDGEEFQGYYLFGEDRNTIVLCGSSERFWVTGDVGELDRLQQLYLSSTRSGSNLLYVVVTGEIDDISNISTYPGHEGLFNLSRVRDARLPRDEDCNSESVGEEGNKKPGADEAPEKVPRQPANKAEPADPVGPADPAVTKATAPEPATVAESSTATSLTSALPIPFDGTQSDESETPASSAGRAAESLRAYFGAWTADCRQDASRVLCLVSTSLQGKGVADILEPVVKLTRRSGKRTVIDLAFPGQEIPSIDRIQWEIDSIDLAALIGSRMRFDDTAAIQELRQRALIRNLVLPQMIAGYKLKITVQEDSSVLSTYTATLIGLTRALRFADDFIASAGN